MKEIFENIVSNWRWKKHPCGPGSTLEYTENLRNNLGPLLKKYNIKSMFDAPCGDYSWMQYVDIKDSTYIGGDIVDFMILKNKELYPSVNFCVFDLTNDKLPDVDLLFCRDCLLHLNFNDIDKVFKNVSQSNIKYVLLSNWFADAENDRDIETGNARYINFFEAPYNFKNSIESIIDFVPGFPHREMVLWPRETIDNYIKGKK